MIIPNLWKVIKVMFQTTNHTEIEMGSNPKNLPPLLCQDLPGLWQPEQLPAALGHQKKLLRFAQSPDLKCQGRPWNPWFSHQNGWNFHEIMDVNKPPTYCMFFPNILKPSFGVSTFYLLGKII